MSMLAQLKKAFEKVTQGHTFFDVPLEGQEKFLYELPEPKDDIERSYLQYRCQNYLLKRGVPLLLNCAAMGLLPLYRYRLQKGKMEMTEGSQAKSVFLFAGPADILPNSLKEEFQPMQIRDFQEHLCLNEEDLAYLRILRKRYPFAFYFRFKCMVKIAMYSYVISAYRPKAAICSEEYSFTCSVLTDYCQSRGVEHINVMHGEKLFFVRDTFVHFHRFYVWDEHYVDLFKKLRGEATQFRIDLPPSLRFSNRDSVQKVVDYTYYLGNEPRELVEKILSVLSDLQEKGAVVAVRLHPLYFSQSGFLREDNRGFLIEEKTDCSIEESLLRTGCALSLYSTVLLQAALNGVPFAIDDVSQKERYEKLLALDFICLNKSHKLLSELVK